MKDKLKEPKADKTTMEVPQPLANMVRFLADHFDITIPEALTKFAQPAVAKEYKRAVLTTAELGGEGG